MVSRTDLAVGVLVFIIGLIILSFAPGFPLYIGGSEHVTTHYVGGFLAIIVGIMELASYRRIGRVEVGVSILSILLGLAFILEVPGMLYAELEPHGLAMELVGALTVIVGLVGIGAAFISKKTTVVPKA
jgi:uncharacterized membrane protein YdcZ (DUF606 family)